MIAILFVFPNGLPDTVTPRQTHVANLAAHIWVFLDRRGISDSFSGHCLLG